MNRAVTATAVAVAALVLLAGCSMSGGSDASSSGNGGMVAPARPESGVDGSGEAASDASGTSTVVGRDVVTAGQLGLTADDPVAAAARAASIVAGVDGRVDSRSDQPAVDGRSASANLVLRIPSAAYDEVVDQLGGLGDVQYYTTQGEDVTQQKTDLDARVGALQASVDRIEGFMAQATSMGDLIDLENALSSRQSELDSLTAQRDQLADQVSYSTLTVYVTAPGVIAPGGPNTFWDGLVTGWSTLVAFIGGALVVLGVLLPWAGLLAVIGAVVLGAVWLAQRRRRIPGTPTDAPLPPAATT